MSATDETQDDKLAHIDALIEASSLGTPAARSLRNRISPEFAAELVTTARHADTVKQPPAAPRETTQPVRRRYIAASFDEVFRSTRLRLLEQSNAIEGLTRLEAAAELQVISNSQAEADQAKAAALADILRAVDQQEEAVVRIGSLIVIKVQNDITVWTISELDAAELDKNPQLLNNPVSALEYFRERHPREKVLNRVRQTDEPTASRVPSNHTVSANLGATAAALLGILHEGPATGGQLVAAARDRLGSFFSVTRSQVYRELPALADAGLVRLGKQGPRSSQQYLVTAAGKKAFKTWLMSAPGPDHLRSPLILRLVHANALTSRQRSELIESAKKVYAEEQNAARAAAESADDAYAKAVAEFGAARAKAVLKLLDSIPTS